MVNKIRFSTKNMLFKEFSARINFLMTSLNFYIVEKTKKTSDFIFFTKSHTDILSKSKILERKIVTKAWLIKSKKQKKKIS